MFRGLGARCMTLWFDVEDLFEYTRWHNRPSGIQRLSYEVYAALQAAAPEHIGFVRHDPLNGTMRVVGWEYLQAIYNGMTRAVPDETTSESRAKGHSTPNLRAPMPLLSSGLGRVPGVRFVARRLPAEVRQPISTAVRAQIATFRALGSVAAVTPGVIAAWWRQRSSRINALADSTDMPAATEQLPHAMQGTNLSEVLRPGDWVVALGAPWSHPDYATFIRAVVGRCGARFGMMVYDLIPLLRPEFCERGLTAAFSNSVGACLPIADRVLAISEATVTDVSVWAARKGIALRATPRAIPIGTGFSHLTPTSVLPIGLSPGSYALFVSTIEARKNHVLAFRAWRRLLDELGPERMPTLVFAGRTGWMVTDLLQQIDNANHLGSKLVIVEDADDAALAALYAGARFTLFPSHYEGWGLPVSESLSFGKVCLAASTTSVPEAGGDFCLYHDPDSVTEAVALYRRAITEPELIPGLEARIRAEYRPTPWSATARAVLDALG